MTEQPPIRRSADAEHTGRACPYCRFPLKEGASMAECGVCGAAHHAECWDDNNGCAIMGCAGGPSAQPASAPAARPAPPAAPPAPPTAPPVGAPIATGYAPPPPPPGTGPRGYGWLIAAVLILTVVVAGGAVAVVLSGNDSKQVASSGSSSSGDQGAGGSSDASGSGSDQGSDSSGSTDVTGSDQGTDNTDNTSNTDNTNLTGDGSSTANTSSVLPDVTRSEMQSDIKSLLYSFHDDLRSGNYSSAWDQLTQRKRDKALAESGYDGWVTNQETVGRHIDPDQLSVELLDVDSSTGVATVKVRMGWTGSSCSEWSGITWVRYEDGEWLYDPGYSTTPQRRAEWQPRAAELFGSNCAT